MTRGRHVPIRSCIGCRSQAPKRALMRIVRQPDGTVRVDPTGKASGRGAYLCLNEDCIRTARKRQSLEKQFKVSIPDAVYEDLLARAAEISRDESSTA